MKDGALSPAEVARGTGVMRAPLLAALTPEADLRELCRRLLRRKWVILGTTVVLTLLAAVVIWQITPRYRAVTQVMIEPRQTHVVNVDQVLSGLSGERETIESEMRVIASRGLAEKVIAKLDLARNPEFNPALRRGWRVLEAINPVAYMPAAWREILKLDRSAVPVAEEELLELDRAAIVDAFLAKLDVVPEGRSRVIGIAVTAEEPSVAAKAANTLAELYLVEQLEAKYEATRIATEWLNERVGDLREKVQASENAVESFRRQAGLLEGKGVTFASQQASELNTQLILARGERAQAEARLRQIETLIKSPNGADTAADVLASPLIQRLKEQEAEVLRRAAELTSQYGPKHPRIVNVQAEAADIRGKIEAEVRKVVQALRNEAAVARAREGSLAGSLDRLGAEVGRANSAEVRLRALEREATANRSLFESFLARLKETSSQQDIQRADARIISRADAPLEPSFPRKRLMLPAAAFIALVLAIAVAFLIEHFDPGFRSSEQIERHLGVAGLGLVPLLSGMRLNAPPPERYVIEKPLSSFAESLRTLHTALLLSNVDQPPRTVLITSSRPREGKSTVSVAMARLLARSGRRVILLDADLRRPRAAGALGLRSQPGLVEVLAGTATLAEAIQVDDETGLHVLGPGAGNVSPPDLFASAHMQSLMADLANHYQLVLLDSPPVLAVSEARILARLVDTTIFVVRWAGTPREVAQLGAKQIQEAGGRIAGAVLTMVNVRKHAGYGYGDSGYYYGAARRYYAN